MRSDNAKLQKGEILLTENVKTLIPRMAIPTIVAQMITTIYNLADAYFVSTLGTNATAAVGVNGALERTISMIASLIGAGACSYISRLLGAKRREDADRVLSTSFFSGLALGIVFFVVLCRTFIRPLVYLLGADDNCALYSMQYAAYVLYAAPFMIGSLILNMCLRSEGSATYAMVGIGTGGVLNCFLDPLFIYVLDMGVAGASLATAISKTVSFCILIFPYVRKKTNVTLALKKVKYALQDIREVLVIGSTSFFRSAMSVLSSIVINNVASSISTSALAALSVSNRVMEFPFGIILGFGQGYQPVAGYNWGAKQMKRIKESLTFVSIVSIVGAVIIGAILFIASGVIVPLFNKQTDPKVLSIGILCIRLQCIALPLHSWGSIINMFYGGIGKAKQALLLSTARQGFCFIPVAFIAPYLWGASGIAATQAIADLITTIIAIPLGIQAYKMITINLNAAESAGIKQV